MNEVQESDTRRLVAKWKIGEEGRSDKSERVAEVHWSSKTGISLQEARAEAMVGG